MIKKKKPGRKKKEVKDIETKKDNNKLILSESDQAIISNIVLKGDISNLNNADKVKYYNLFCRSLNLNPATQPFQIITFKGGKETLYATKDATEQLRKINGVSITDSIQAITNGILIVKVKGHDKSGREDCGSGAVNVAGLKGDGLANAIMKCETKAKRRFTLSICGLGALDETEIETIPDTSINKKFENDSIIDIPEKTNKPETTNEKPINDISYYRDAITKNIISWTDLKNLMIEVKIIRPGTYKKSELDRILKNLTPESNQRLRVSIETLLNKIGVKQ